MQDSLTFDIRFSFSAFALVLMGVVLLWAPRAAAWKGFDWNTWLEISRPTKPAITSPQAGLADLLPLLVQDGPASAPITTPEQWAAKRARIIGVLDVLLGEPATPLRVPTPTAEFLGDEDMGTYIRRHLRIRAESDDWIPAYLLLPKKPVSSPAPAMVCLHQTQAPGKEETCGMTGDPDMAFGVELVQRGYVCIAPDVIGFGERIPPGTEPYHNAHDFYRKHPDWSFFGKMVWDFQRVVDYLQTLPEVDPDRIGSIGHSHGAYGTIMCALFEPRIKAAIASCGFNTLRTDPNPERWSKLTALMPLLGLYLDDITQAPIDWHEIVACIAPRAYFNWATLEDGIFPNTDNLADIYRQLEALYALHNAPGAFEGHLVPGKHRFPIEGREKAYAWLEGLL